MVAGEPGMYQTGRTEQSEVAPRMFFIQAFEIGDAGRLIPPPWSLSGGGWGVGGFCGENTWLRAAVGVHRGRFGDSGGVGLAPVRDSLLGRALSDLDVERPPSVDGWFVRFDRRLLGWGADEPCASDLGSLSPGARWLRSPLPRLPGCSDWTRGEAF